MMQIPGMRDRTILINSMSKTYSVTGWRVGWVLASPDLTASIRKVHDFLTVGAPAPLQQAGVIALQLPDEYYADLAAAYERKRNRMLRILEAAGFRCFRPQGACYVMTDISGFGYGSDAEFMQALVEQAGVVGVPGSSFFAEGRKGSSFVRFCFCKKEETLQQAEARLSQWAEKHALSISE